jgi:aryl-alcohol dehydrogenase-like predicted oxidoreductase
MTPSMPTRKLGTQGLQVSAIGMGCMGLSFAYGARPTEEEAVRVLDRAIELGVTFFDTAEVYGPFQNEILVGRTLRRVRERVVIATKFGFDIPPEGGRPRGVNSRPEHIREVCSASLKRLGVDTIDLLYQHRVDPQVPIEEVAGAVGDLVRQGKVRYFGLSEAGADTLRRAHATHPVSALQSEYSLWTRGPERKVLPVCRALGIGFVPYSPLGRGFLAGSAASPAPDDFRRSLPRWRGEALAKNLSLVETLAALARAKGCTAAQLALAWLLHQGRDIVPIPGTTKVHRVEENVAAAHLHLTPEELAAIEAAVPESAVEGARYDEAGMALIENS